MTRTLILTRHAKSSWATPGLADHDRPLNKRGVRSAKALGHWMRNKGWQPDQVLCSSSRRTRDTYAGLDLMVQPELRDALFHASSGQMLRVLGSADGQTVLMLGHNPGIADFAARLARDPPDHHRFHDYPTGATLVLKFDISGWDQAVWQSGKAMDFTIPCDLLGT